MDHPLPEPLAGLVHDHRVVEEVVSRAREAVAAATTHDACASAIDNALEQARDLEAFAAVDLTLHIAKEEEVLFPAVRRMADAEMATVITDMIAQHDQVREGEHEIRQLLISLDADHEELRVSTVQVSRDLRAAHEDRSRSAFVNLHAAVRTLDAVLQGHFVDEEDNVFEVIEGWFEPGALEDLRARMERLEAAYV